MMLYRLSAALALVLLLSASSKHQVGTPYAVEEVPLKQISADLARGAITSVQVTRAYIERIKTYDGALHAVLLLAPDALDQAAASDRRRAAGKALGPLDGIPILVKDNIDAAGMVTTAGSYALIENMPRRDSELVRRLRAAGAVILGKANLSQFAGLRTTDTFEGSTVGGVGHNPYDLSRSPSGSSLGSGIAVAASLAAAAIGTDTTGSIIGPASYMGLVGLRPTLGLISRRGIVPVDLTEDTAGPLTRNVADTAMLLTALAGSDPADPATRDADSHKTDYTRGLDRHALKGVRLGVIRNVQDYSDTTKPVLDAALRVLAKQGAELVELPADVFEDLNPEQRLLMLYGFKVDLPAYLAEAPPAVKVRTLADVIAFDRIEAHERTHRQDLFEDSEATSGGRDNPEYLKALHYAQHRAGPEGIDRALSQFRLNALVLLAFGPAIPIVPDGTKAGGSALDLPKGVQQPFGSGIAALAGDPDLTVPMGAVHGLPVGLSFIGPAWSEQQLLAYAYAYEQAAHARVPPKAYQAAVAAN
jgi:amidase